MKSGLKNFHLITAGKPDSKKNALVKGHIADPKKLKLLVIEVLPYRYQLHLRQLPKYGKEYHQCMPLL
jgi:hypothetical protein